MLTTLGIVQACFHLPRFRVNATRKLGGRSLFEWVIRRVTEAMRLDGVVVVAPESDDAEMIRRLVPNDVPVFFGRGSDALACFTNALEHCNAEGCVRVRGDNLFIDPGTIDRLVTTAHGDPDCDFAGYCSRDGQPAVFSPTNVFGEWFRTSALRKAERLARETADRADVTRFIYSHPEKFRLRLIPAPTEIDRDDVRLTVDVDEDWDHALTIYDALGPELPDWRRIARLLDHQPGLRDRMAALNRAHRQPVTV